MRQNNTKSTSGGILMGDQKERFEKLEEYQEKAPLFDAADGKILAVGDMFRGPYTGITSDIALNNPGKRLPVEDDPIDLR